MAAKISAKELIEKMAAEIGRLQKLCKANGIDYIPHGLKPAANMAVTANVTVFKTKKEAEEYQKKINTK